MRFSSTNILRVVTFVTLSLTQGIAFAQESATPAKTTSESPPAVTTIKTTPPPVSLTDDIIKNKPPAPPNMQPPDIGVLRERLELLNEFLSLPPEKLAKIRQTVESIEKMSPAERERLTKAVGQFYKMHPDQQKSLARRFEKLSPEDRELIREHWMKLSPQERDAERARLQKLTPEERTEFEQNLVAKIRADQATDGTHHAPASVTTPGIVEEPVNNTKN